ncbi:hypothetical protein SEVIR_4G240901v4 [Setaria viridis]
MGVDLYVFSILLLITYPARCRSSESDTKELNKSSSPGNKKNNSDSDDCCCQSDKVGLGGKKPCSSSSNNEINATVQI